MNKSGCGHFYPVRERACPECGHPANRINKWLVTAGLNSNLYEQAERAARNA